MVAFNDFDKKDSLTQFQQTIDKAFGGKETAILGGREVTRGQVDGKYYQIMRDIFKYAVANGGKAETLTDYRLWQNYGHISETKKASWNPKGRTELHILEKKIAIIHPPLARPRPETLSASARTARTGASAPTASAGPVPLASSTKTAPPPSSTSSSPEPLTPTQPSLPLPSAPIKATPLPAPAFSEPITPALADPAEPPPLTTAAKTTPPSSLEATPSPAPLAPTETTLPPTSAPVKATPLPTPEFSESATPGSSASARSAKPPSSDYFEVVRPRPAPYLPEERTDRDPLPPPIVPLSPPETTAVAAPLPSQASLSKTAVTARRIYDISQFHFVTIPSTLQSPPLIQTPKKPLAETPPTPTSPASSVSISSASTGESQASTPDSSPAPKPAGTSFQEKLGRRKPAPSPGDSIPPFTMRARRAPIFSRPDFELTPEPSPLPTTKESAVPGRPALSNPHQAPGLAVPAPPIASGPSRTDFTLASKPAEPNETSPQEKPTGGTPNPSVENPAQPATQASAAARPRMRILPRGGFKQAPQPSPLPTTKEAAAPGRPVLSDPHQAPGLPLPAPPLARRPSPTDSTLAAKPSEPNETSPQEKPRGGRPNPSVESPARPATHESAAARPLTLILPREKSKPTPQPSFPSPSEETLTPGRHVYADTQKSPDSTIPAATPPLDLTPTKSTTLSETLQSHKGSDPVAPLPEASCRFAKDLPTDTPHDEKLSNVKAARAIASFNISYGSQGDYDAVLSVLSGVWLPSITESGVNIGDSSAHRSLAYLKLFSCHEPETAKLLLDKLKATDPSDEMFWSCFQFALLKSVHELATQKAEEHPQLSGLVTALESPPFNISKDSYKLPDVFCGASLAGDNRTLLSPTIVKKSVSETLTSATKGMDLTTLLDDPKAFREIWTANKAQIFAS